MKLYWTVHINRFDDFIDYILREYNKEYKLNNFEEIYYLKANYVNLKVSNYLYFCITDDHNNYNLTSVYYNDNNKVMLDFCNYKYMGEFNLRKEKLNRLNSLNKFV